MLTRNMQITARGDEAEKKESNPFCKKNKLKKSTVDHRPTASLQQPGRHFFSKRSSQFTFLKLFTHIWQHYLDLRYFFMFSMKPVQKRPKISFLTSAVTSFIFFYFANIFAANIQGYFGQTTFSMVQVIPEFV